MWRIAMLCAVVLLSACTSYTEVERTAQEYEITKIKPPKRLYVTLKDLKTNEVTRVYVSKRCSRWREIKVGSTVTLTKVTLRNDQGEMSTRVEGKSAICPR